VVLFELLRRRLGGLNGGLILRSFVKVVISSAVAGAVAWCALRVISGQVDPSRTLGALIAVFGSAIPAVFVYTGMIYLLRVDEAREVWRLVSARLRRRAA